MYRTVLIGILVLLLIAVSTNKGISQPKGSAPAIDPRVDKLVRQWSDRHKKLTHYSFQVIDTIETYRDLLSGLLDLYMSSISNRMNEVMKVLTIIATIFIPLTFIAGVYGMNFRNMPELGWGLGYPLTLLVMILIVIMMMFYFRSKKWL